MEHPIKDTQKCKEDTNLNRVGAPPFSASSLFNDFKIPSPLYGLECKSIESGTGLLGFFGQSIAVILGMKNCCLDRLKKHISNAFPLFFIDIKLSLNVLLPSFRKSNFIYEAKQFVFEKM